MERLLVTTAIEETWGNNDDHLIFLGEWGRDYNRKNIWNKRSHNVLPYHWTDREKFANDHSYLEQLHEKILDSLSILLNQIHDLDNPKSYWRIVVGRWLLTYIPILWDKWECLRFAENFCEYDKIISLRISRKDCIPSDYTEFTDFFHSHLWNNHIYAKIIDFHKNSKHEYKETKLKIKRSFQVFSKKRKIISFLEKILLKLPVREKVLFSTSYFDILSLIRLSIKLRQIPLLHTEFDEILRSRKLEVINLNLSSKRNESLNMKCDNNFEKFVCKNLLNQLPMLILEGFSSLLIKTKKIKTDANLIFSANNHMCNLFFQTWIAEKINKGARFISSSHGGGIPDRYSMFKHEELISYKKTTWHIPCFDNHVQLTPNKISKKYRKVGFGNYLLLIGFEFSLYSNRCQSGPGSSLYFEEYNKNLKFCRLLNNEPFKMLKIKPHKHNVISGWNTYKRYIDDISAEKISSEKILSHAIHSSKLIVCTYPQTSFLESMLSGVPTILLYLEKYWETDPVFDDLIECLKNAKIIFSDTKMAAKHVNTIWNNPIEWWNSEKVLTAREIFQKKCGKHNPNWLKEWSLFFKNEI